MSGFHSPPLVPWEDGTTDGARLVQDQADAVQHALSMIGGTGWIARSEAEIALGRLAAWAERGLQESRKHGASDG